ALRCSRIIRAVSRSRPATRDLRHSYPASAAGARGCLERTLDTTAVVNELPGHALSQAAVCEARGWSRGSLNKRKSKMKTKIRKRIKSRIKIKSRILGGRTRRLESYSCS